MPANVPIVLSLLVLVSILSSTYGQHVGDLCIVDNSAGVCKLLHGCPKIYEDLLGGKLPGKTCGYTGFDPIVCCPINQTTSTTMTMTPTTSTMMTPSPQEQTTVKPWILDGSRGSLTRARCVENAKAVYGLAIPPMLPLSQPVNISLCALTTRKLIISNKVISKEFPHMAAIGYDSPNGTLWLCGGTLISPKIVLTAAHCIWAREWGNANWVRLGDLNLAQTNDDAMPQTIAIKERIKHPDYQRPKLYHDIAILRLEKEATYNAYVRPACLSVDVDNSNKALATGWDPVNSDGVEGAGNQLKSTVSLVSHENCNASYFENNSSVLPLGIVNEWQICGERSSNDNCPGDSGGPLVVFNKVHECVYDVIGITSFGRGCDGRFSGVYTRVYNYIPWIEATAWPEYL